MKAIRASRTACCIGCISPLRRLGVLQGKSGPHRTHGGPSVPNRPWRAHLPDGPRGGNEGEAIQPRGCPGGEVLGGPPPGIGTPPPPKG
jgi:hypothetical protein